MLQITPVFLCSVCVFFVFVSDWFKLDRQGAIGRCYAAIPMSAFPAARCALRRADLLLRPEFGISEAIPRCCACVCFCAFKNAI